MNTMKVGAMNNPKADVLSEVTAFGELGFDYVDLTIEWPNATPETILGLEPQLRELLSSHNLGLVGHSPWFFDITHPYPRVRKALQEEFKDILGVCHKLEVSKLTVHPGSSRLYSGDNRDLLVPTTVEFLGELVESAASYDVTASFEPFGIKSMSTDELEEIMSALPKLGLTLDVGHANVGGNRLNELVDRLGDRVDHVHVSDNRGVNDDHLPFGVGTLDWEAAVAAIKGIGYDDTVTVEIHTPDRDYLKLNREKLLDCWEK